MKGCSCSKSFIWDCRWLRFVNKKTLKCWVYWVKRPEFKKLTPERSKYNLANTKSLLVTSTSRQRISNLRELDKYQVLTTLKKCFAFFLYLDRLWKNEIVILSSIRIIRNTDQVSLLGVGLFQHWARQIFIIFIHFPKLLMLLKNTDRFTPFETTFNV